jgi:hypothetical protein
MKLNPADEVKKEKINARNSEADAAYEAELEPSRLSLKNPHRVPYTETMPRALAAYDKVMAKWRSHIWGK